MARWTRFRQLLGPDPKGDVEAELSFHLDMRIRELVEQGESPERARELALHRFGDYDRSRLECVEIDERRTRRMHLRDYIAELRQDAAYALRMLARAPGFTAVAVVTLALGIGASSAIFSVVHGVLLESLPFPAADRLYRIRTVYPDGNAYSTLSAPDFMSLREENRVFEQVDAYTTGIVTLLGAGEPREVRVASVSDGLFTLLGMPVILGRGFLPGENQPGQNGVAVLDHGFWQRAFGGDHGVINRRVLVGGAPYTIVGVLAQGARLPADVPGARVPSEADLYLPIEYGEAFSASTPAQRRSNYLGVLAQARPGTIATQIDEDLRRIGTRLQAAFPETNEALTFNAISARDLMLGDVRTPLLMLLGAVGFVLLVACANVASLMLARASVRGGELAVRAALGAGRARLLRQLLTEAMVLGLIGGAVGLALAYWGTQALVAAQPADIPRLDEIGLDRTVVLFTLAIALLASLAFGMVPALQATRDRSPALRASGRGGGADRKAHRVRGALVVAEIALAVVLLTGAGLLIRSFIALTQVDPAFRAEHAVSFRVTLFGRGYDMATVQRRVMQFETELRALPGVSAVAATTVLPLSGPGPRLAFSVAGAPAPPPNVNPEIGVASVTPDYFQTIGTPLVRGRGFTDGDRGGTPPVVIINEAAVRRWFAGVDPIGKRVEMSGTREVVGVVADVLQGHPGQPIAPQLFAPYAQRPSRSIRIVLRTAGDPLALGPSIRARIHALDANLAVGDITPLDQLIAGSVARPRFYTALLALFAAVALALAAIGIFGVMSYAVAERTREIGIRMALGAHAGSVLRMIVGRAVILALLGVIIGMAAALALGRVIQNQLFGVRLVDPLTLSVVVLVLMASAAAAGFLPARRAAHLDPGSALRQG